jgi:hypothetical protein
LPEKKTDFAAASSFNFAAVLLLLGLIWGCDRAKPANTTAAVKQTSGATHGTIVDPPAVPADELVQLSRYGRSLYCSLAQTPDGTLHAIYTDQPDGLRNSFLYYRASTDAGATWSEPKNLSDDESGLPSYFCQVRVDGKGRVYAIWKYLSAASDTLDGPGSASCGVLAYRCLNGGEWSKIVRLSTKEVPSTSFFAANAPDGAVNVIFAAGPPDRDWVREGGVQCHQATVIKQAALDGGNMPTPRTIIAPKPVPTKAQIDAAHAAGNEIPLYEQQPRPDGLWNLRGYVDEAGAAHFIGEHNSEYGIPGGSSKDYYVLFDGAALHKLWTIESGNNFNNPPTLLVDAAGKEHLLKTPEHAERIWVRDYPVTNGQLGDPTDVIGPEKPEGTISNWQAVALPGGRMAVTCAISQKGGWDPDDVELYLTTSDGAGKWAKPICVTNNAARRAFMSKQTAAGGVMKSDTYRPDFADSIALKHGGMGVLMVNTNKSIIGITNNHISGSGQVFGSLASGSSAAPWAYYKKAGN